MVNIRENFYFCGLAGTAPSRERGVVIVRERGDSGWSGWSGWNEWTEGPAFGGAAPGSASASPDQIGRDEWGGSSAWSG